MEEEQNARNHFAARGNSAFFVIINRHSPESFNIEHSVLTHPPHSFDPLNIHHSTLTILPYPLLSSHSDRLGRSKKVEWPSLTRRRILQRRHANFFSDATMQSLTP